MKLHSVTELRASAGKILDRALSGRPQYILRGGAVAVIARAELFAGVKVRPPGYFAEAYRSPDPERLALESAMAAGLRHE